MRVRRFGPGHRVRNGPGSDPQGTAQGVRLVSGGTGPLSHSAALRQSRQTSHDLLSLYLLPLLYK